MNVKLKNQKSNKETESEASAEVKLSNQDELVKHNEPCTETLKDGGHTEALCKFLWGWKKCISETEGK